VAALYSPSTGIIDSHALMLAYLGDAEDRGAMLALKSPLLDATVEGDGFTLRVEGAEPIKTRILVNSAGLRAPSVAGRIEGFDRRHIPRELYAKGNYYTLSGRAPFSRLVYPVPEPGGLGVHVTLDLAGQARFGPDVEWVDGIDYRVDPKRAERFYAAIRRYWPGLPDGALAPGYAGIRPKTAGAGEAAPDFAVQGPRAHGVPGLVHLFGIESPGLTSSLALAALVLDELG
jgi:L-2-hydroxyglutarate oxidase LhgO